MGIRAFLLSWGHFIRIPTRQLINDSGSDSKIDTKYRLQYFVSIENDRKNSWENGRYPAIFHCLKQLCRVQWNDEYLLIFRKLRTEPVAYLFSYPKCLGN